MMNSWKGALNNLALAEDDEKQVFDRLTASAFAREGCSEPDVWFNLALCYDGGMGVSEDKATAAQHYTRVSKSDAFVLKTKDFALKNEGFCIENEDSAFKMMNFAGGLVLTQWELRAARVCREQPGGVLR